MILCQVCGLPLKNEYGLTQHLKYKRKALDQAHISWQENQENETLKEQTKVCRICGFEKNKDEFGKSSSCRGGRRHQCKSCIDLRNKQANPTRFWNESAKYKSRSKKKTRNAQLLKDHGITLIQYEELLERQGGCCAICGTSNNGLSRWGTPANFHVDHDHNTNIVRGLLCFPCNKGLGMFKDNPLVLKKAAQYLLVQLNSGAPQTTSASQ